MVQAGRGVYEGKSALNPSITQKLMTQCSVASFDRQLYASRCGLFGALVCLLSPVMMIIEAKN